VEAQGPSGAPEAPAGTTPPAPPVGPIPVDDTLAGRRTKLAVEIVLGLLGIGAAVGVSVGLAEHSVALGFGFGFAAALLTAFLIWLLFGPLKKPTLWVMKPVLDRFEPVSNAVAGLVGFVSGPFSLFR
jgi:hypothetical protein